MVRIKSYLLQLELGFNNIPGYFRRQNITSPSRHESPDLPLIRSILLPLELSFKLSFEHSYDLPVKPSVELFVELSAELPVELPFLVLLMSEPKI